MKFLKHNGTHNVVVCVGSKEYTILKNAYNNTDTLNTFLPGCLFIVVDCALTSINYLPSIYCEFELKFVGYDEKRS